MADAAAIAVKSIAAKLGIEEINTKKLSTDANVFIVKILDVAKSLMIMDRRTRMTERDINEVLTIYHIEPVLGYFEQPRKLDTIKFDQTRDLVVEREEFFPIDHCTNIETLKFPLKLDIDCQWVVSDNRVIMVPEPGEEPEPEEDLDALLQVSDCKIGSKLQMYFEKTISFFKSGGADYEAALFRISKSEGVGGLLPRYLDFMMELLTTKQDNLKLMHRVIKLLRCIVANNCFNAISRIEDVVSIALTVLFSPGDGRDTYSMRDDVAELIGFMCEEYHHVLIQLEGSIGMDLLNAIFNAPLCGAAFYGAIKAFDSLELETIRLLFLPEFWRIKECLESRDYSEDACVMIWDALVTMVGRCLTRDQWMLHDTGYAYDLITSCNYEMVSQIIGEALVQYQIDDSSFLFV